MTTPSGPATQTLIEVYFTEMIAALLKSYILIQLAYLTLASTVRCLYYYNIQIVVPSKKKNGPRIPDYVLQARFTSI